MHHIPRLLLAAISLALGACIHYQADTRPQTIERGGVQTADNRCELGDYTVYRQPPRDPKPFDSKAPRSPYDAVIPPTYDAPSQLPSYCADELGK